MVADIPRGVLDPRPAGKRADIGAPYDKRDPALGAELPAKGFVGVCVGAAEHMVDMDRPNALCPEHPAEHMEQTDGIRASGKADKGLFFRFVEPVSFTGGKNLGCQRCGVSILHARNPA